MNGKRARALRKFTAHMKNHGDTRYGHNVDAKRSYKSFKKNYVSSPVEDYSIFKKMEIPENWDENDKKNMDIVDGKVRLKIKKEGKKSTNKRINQMLVKISNKLKGGKNEEGREEREESTPAS